MPKPCFDFFGLYFVNGSTCKSTNIAIQPNYQVNRDNSLNIALARFDADNRQTNVRTNKQLGTYVRTSYSSPPRLEAVQGWM